MDWKEKERKKMARSNKKMLRKKDKVKQKKKSKGEIKEKKKDKEVKMRKGKSKKGEGQIAQEKQEKKPKDSAKEKKNEKENEEGQKNVNQKGKKKRRLFQDEDFMRLALKEARKAFRRQEVPVGAVLVVSGSVIARAHNQPIKSLDPTAHAEILVMRRAARRLGNYRLPHAELFVTLEPCTMCLGAAVQARIKRIVYGAPDPKAGAVSSIMSFPWEKMNHRPEIQGGLLASEAATLMQEFFRARRQGKKGEIDFS
jgi:tRNA(adenine34) deaminase